MTAHPESSAPETTILERLQPLCEAIDEQLERVTASAPGCPDRLTAAIRYSVLNPGKRLRPILALLACEAVGEDWRKALPAACAVELIHVYSLIHDDLPAMDNDRLRRGKPTCHVQFDEATAILAGDSLQMLAIECVSHQLPAPIALKCCQILSRAAGRAALVGGQSDDLAAEGRFGPMVETLSEPVAFLHSVHLRKTSALIEASLQLGGVVAEASSDQLERLATFGRAVGLAFQIVDDCLDVDSTPEQLGKTPGKDSEQGKLTYPALMGVQASRDLAQRLVRDACAAASVFSERSTSLNELAQFVVKRSR